MGYNYVLPKIQRFRPWSFTSVISLKHFSSMGEKHRGAHCWIKSTRDIQISGGVHRLQNSGPFCARIWIACKGASNKHLYWQCITYSFIPEIKWLQVPHAIRPQKKLKFLANKFIGSIQDLATDKNYVYHRVLGGATVFNKAQNIMKIK